MKLLQKTVSECMGDYRLRFFLQRQSSNADNSFLHLGLRWASSFLHFRFRYLQSGLCASYCFLNLRDVFFSFRAA
jgi:hypothetical protein